MTDTDTDTDTNTNTNRKRTLNLQSDTDTDTNTDAHKGAHSDTGSSTDTEPTEGIELTHGDEPHAHPYSERSQKQKYQMMKESVDALRQQVEGMEYTIDRLSDAADDELVMQQLEGGVLVEVPPQDRDKVLENVRSVQDQLSSRLGNHEDIIDRVEGDGNGNSDDDGSEN